jgi:hypothetical protein
MRFCWPIAVCAVTFAVLGATGCNKGKEAALMSKLSAEERLVVGDWTPVADKSDPNAQKLAEMMGGDTDAPMLKIKLDKIFSMDVMGTTALGTWKWDKDRLRLSITSIDGKAPAEVEKAWCGMGGQSGFGSGSMQPYSSEARSAVKALMRHMSLSVAECYREMQLSPDRKQLVTMAKMPEGSMLFGVTKAFQKAAK